MLPKTHFIINLIISLILLKFFPPFYVLIFFLSSVLIDVDHYLFYIIEEKDFSLKNAYKWYKLNRTALKLMSKEERKKHKNWVLIFHGLEPLIILFLISRTYYFFLFIFLGFLVHLVEDLFEDIPLGVAERKLFLIYAIFKHVKNRRFLSTVRIQKNSEVFREN